MIVPSQLDASFTMLDKLVDRFPLPPVAPPIGDTSLTHVMRLATHSTTSPTPIAMGHSFIMTLYNVSKKMYQRLHYFCNICDFFSHCWRSSHADFCIRSVIIVSAKHTFWTFMYLKQLESYGKFNE
jgi:hypothetical protein